MKLISIELRNVGPYAGAQRMDFNVTKERPVILIGGQNGGGKTTFLDSIQLCLFGQKAKCAGREKLSYEDYLKSLITRGENENDASGITLEFSESTTGVVRNFKVNRSWARNNKQSIREEIAVEVDGEYDKLVSRNWRDYVEDIFPNDLAELFLFDGEKIKDLANVDSSSEIIRSAVGTLLGLNSYSTVRTDLATLRRRLISSAGTNHETVAEDNFDSELERLNETREKLRLLNAKNDEALREHEKRTLELEKHTFKFEREGADVYSRRDAISSELSQTIAKIERIESEIAGYLASDFPFVLVFKRLVELESIAKKSSRLQEAKTIVEFLPGYHESLLREFGEEHKELARVLQAKLGEIVKTASEDGPILEPGSERMISATISRLRDSGPVILAKRFAHQELLEKSYLLERELATIPDEAHVKDLIDKQNELKILAELSESELGLVRQELEHTQALESKQLEVIAELEARKLEMLAVEDRLRRKIETIDEASEVLRKLTLAQLKKHISRIEELTLESFHALVRKSELISKVTINPDNFEMRLFGDTGLEIAYSSISSGERQILATALLWGLARAAGREMPTVIDTPLGRLDSVNRRLVVENYFPYASGQVILLSTDEEITPRLYPLLEEFISDEYHLEFHEDTNLTTITKGYPWKAE